MAEPDLHFEKFLGKGVYGSVSLFKTNEKCDGKTQYTAVKTSDRKHAKALYREFRILSELKGCPGIVQCYGNRVENSRNDEGHREYKISMEYASGGSLCDFTDKFEDRKLPDPIIRKFTCMILEGLATIHEHGYVHCDLKPDNILVFPTCVYKKDAWSSSCELKITDFGLSRRDGNSNWWSPDRPFAGTPIYMSPESVSHGETGKGLDLWSLGCVVLEMYTGKSPSWWRKNFDVKDLKKPEIPSDLPFDAKLFLKTCFAAETEERKDALTLLRHSFLHGYVKKTREPPVNVKKENQRKFSLQLKNIVQRLSEIRNIGVCAY